MKFGGAAGLGAGGEELAEGTPKTRPSNPPNATGTCHHRVVAAELWYRKDLFKGTAEYYDRFRPGYPAELLDDLRARAPLGRSSRLLDLACGTGQVTFALAADVAEVWAVDQEAESIEFGRNKAQRLGIDNIRWIAAAAEDVALEETFDLVAVGNAFHRLDRDAVARRLVSHLGDGGCIALLWGGSPWPGDQPWQRVLADTLERWNTTVAGDRVPEGWEQAMERDPHDAVLQRAGLSYEGRFEFSLPTRWTLDSLVGFVYSTSFLNRSVLGPEVDAFESDLGRQLLPCCTDGVFEQDLTFAYELARRTA
jgi:SAM-dependent methyltransferase